MAKAKGSEKLEQLKPVKAQLKKFKAKHGHAAVQRAKLRKLLQQRGDVPARSLEQPKADDTDSRPSHARNGAGATTTQAEPFRLATEQRGAAHSAKMTARLATEEAALRGRTPLAHKVPVSTFVPEATVKRKARGLTMPEPFDLATETRHESYQEQKRRKREAEEAAKREEAAKGRPPWNEGPYTAAGSDA